MTDKVKLIKASLIKEVKIEFDYQGGVTTVDPYIYGLSSMGDNILYGKAWHSDGEHFYRFDLDKISNLKLLKEKFTKDLLYKRPEFMNECWAEISL